MTDKPTAEEVGDFNEVLNLIYGDFNENQKSRLEFGYRQVEEGEGSCSTCNFRVNDEEYIPELNPIILRAFCEFVKGPLYSNGVCKLFYSNGKE
tara:strand:+ start:731 stop:1012 length:282 start_codon:yes stop_codon:yes gene_type:complete